MNQNGTYQRKPEPATLSEYVFGRVPPQALPLEEAVLGAIMLDRDALPGIIDLLTPESFYLPAHQAVFSACLKLFGKGEPIDVLTVSEQLRRDGAGVQSHELVDMCNRIASSANLEYHARIVSQKALQRDLIQTANETIKAAFDEGTDAFDLLTATQTRLYNMANFGGRNAESVGRIGIDVIRQAAISMQKPDGITGVPSGLKAVDKTTGGWQPSDLVVIAARPGMGKTAFVLNAAMHAAKSGVPTAFFSLEMGRSQLVERLIAVQTGISANNIRRGQVTNDDLRRMQEAAEGLNDLPLFIDDTPGLSIFELRAKCRRLKLQHNIGFVIVDYLQLMSGASDNRNSNREQEISQISRGCKNLAKEMNVPVIALSQLSRAVETRGGAKRPQLSDLRESGAIEQDADMVGFLYRPEYYGILEDETGAPLKGVCEFIISKHRHGALDNIGLAFHDATTKFSDLSQAGQTITPAAPPAVDWTIPASARPAEDVDIPF